MNSTGRQLPPVPETIFPRGYEWNTIPDTTPPMYLTRTGIRLKSSTKASGRLRSSNLTFNQQQLKCLTVDFEIASRFLQL